MKKKGLLAALLLLFAATAAYAQPRAIGGRVGGQLEVSYQHALGSANMVQVELGMGALFAPGIEAAATYDWIFPINSWQYKGTWNWYAGVGAGVGGYWYGYGYGYDHHNHGVGYVGVAGRIGVEYNFWFPLQLSLDWRPLIGPDFDNNEVGFNEMGLYSGIALGVRYLF